MAFLSTTVMDDGLNAGLQDIAAAGDADLYICTTEPTTVNDATTTYVLGIKAGISIAEPSDDGANGREVVVAQINDGSVTGNGDAAYWAIIDNTSPTLLATGSLSSSQTVTSGNTFTLTSFSIGIPAPA